MALAARITGTGCYLPAQVLTNRDLEHLVETTDEWIRERSGIRERRIAAPEETTSTLGAEAARRALASAGIEAASLDLIITATCTPDGMLPASATHIQRQIGATRAASFDLNAACTGFLSGLSTAAQFIQAGSAERVLVVGAEVLSRILDWTDRGTCVLFGDGAGAAIVERAPEGEPGGIESFVLRSDGSQCDILYAPGPASARPGGVISDYYVVMDGPAVFRQAVSALAASAAEAIAQAGLTVEDITLCVPHQANLRILNAVARNLGLPEERVYVNLQRYGNTSAATIPIALCEAAAEGRLRPGDRVLMAAFGGGLTWGAMVIEWAGVRHTPLPGNPASGSALTRLQAARQVR